VTPAELIASYIKLRRKLEKIAEKHKQELEPYLKLRGQIENTLLDHLNQTGLDSTKCEAGTAYRSTSTSVVVKDWVKTLGFIKENQAWELLEARVAKTATVELINERNEPVPGVEVTSATVLRVRTG
jgi:hypothetical protein